MSADNFPKPGEHLCINPAKVIKIHQEAMRQADGDERMAALLLSVANAECMYGVTGGDFGRAVRVMRQTTESVFTQLKTFLQDDNLPKP